MLYAVTVRYTRIVPDEFNYYNWIACLPKSQRVLQMQLERKHGLHLHLLVDSDSDTFIYKKSIGVHVLTEPIHDYKGWLRYILKEHPDCIDKEEYIENFRTSNALKRIRVV